MPKALENAGATPGKLVLIGVLAVVFVVVVGVQLWPSSAAATTAMKADADAGSEDSPRSKGRSTAPARKANAADQPLTSTQPDWQAWTAPPLQTVLAHDPFVPFHPMVASKQTDETAVAETSDTEDEMTNTLDRQLLADLQTDGVSMVMITARERLAKVGDRDLRIGDNVGGYIVQDINMDGVVLVENAVP
jgi:hypothetical protein